MCRSLFILFTYVDHILEIISIIYVDHFIKPKYIHISHEEHINNVDHR